jgi:hypothetical protein
LYLCADSTPKQEKRQNKNNRNKKEFQLSQLNIKVKYKENIQLMHDYHEYMVAQDIDIQQVF